MTAISVYSIMSFFFKIQFDFIILPGSGPFGAVAQMFWLGQPAQASFLPANSLSGPFFF